MTAADGFDKPTISSETIEVLKNRVSVRKYAPDPVTDAHVTAILEAALRAPTSSNVQACSVVVVRDAQKKAHLAELAGNQKHIADCPVFLAFCADMSRMDSAFMRHDHNLDDSNNLEMGLVATIDASLVGMAAYVAADSLGIHGVMIGGMRNDPNAVAEVLNLPGRVYVVFGMCLGFPAEAPKQKPRMPLEGVVHRETYNAEASLGTLDPYNAALKDHYVSIGKQTTDDSWSFEVAKKLGKGPRPGLRAALKARGFDFT